jgi:hypothetical protein
MERWALLLVYARELGALVNVLLAKQCEKSTLNQGLDAVPAVTPT